MKMFLRNATLIGFLAANSFAQAAEGPSKFADFAVSAAHSRNFMRCDAAIREVHEFAAGEDMRTNTYQYPNSLRMISIFGNRNDAAQIDATYMPAGNKCKYSTSLTLITNKSCVAELASSTAFKYEAEVAGVIQAKNAGGVNMFLSPVGSNYCVKTFVRDGEK